MNCINYQLLFLEKLKKVFELRDHRWSDDGPLKKGTSEHIWQS